MHDGSKARVGEIGGGGKAPGGAAMHSTATDETSEFSLRPAAFHPITYKWVSVPHGKKPRKSAVSSVVEFLFCERCIRSPYENFTMSCCSSPKEPGRERLLEATSVK